MIETPSTDPPESSDENVNSGDKDTRVEKSSFREKLAHFDEHYNEVTPELIRECRRVLGLSYLNNFYHTCFEAINDSPKFHSEQTHRELYGEEPSGRYTEKYKNASPKTYRVEIIGALGEAGVDQDLYRQKCEEFIADCAAQVTIRNEQGDIMWGRKKAGKRHQKELEKALEKIDTRLAELGTEIDVMILSAYKILRSRGYSHELRN